VVLVVEQRELVLVMLRPLPLLEDLVHFLEALALELVVLPKLQLLEELEVSMHFLVVLEVVPQLKTLIHFRAHSVSE
jgi:hypothetical protein